MMNSSSNRHQQIEQLLTEIAADFFNKESNRTSLITVTRASVSENRQRATIFFTVLPETHEQPALEFANRNKEHFREFFKKHARLKRIPQFEFTLDFGEKNRQRIDTLLGE